MVHWAKNKREGTSCVHTHTEADKTRQYVKTGGVRLRIRPVRQERKKEFRVQISNTYGWRERKNEKRGGLLVYTEGL